MSSRQTKAPQVPAVPGVPVIGLTLQLPAICSCTAPAGLSLKGPSSGSHRRACRNKPSSLLPPGFAKGTSRSPGPPGSAARGGEAVVQPRTGWKSGLRRARLLLTAPHWGRSLREEPELGRRTQPCHALAVAWCAQSPRCASAFSSVGCRCISDGLSLQHPCVAARNV